MNNVARYTVKHTSHGYALVLNFRNGDGELIGYYPNRAEATATVHALNSLHAGR